MTEGEFVARVDLWRSRHLPELGLAHWDFHFEFDENADDVKDGRGAGAEATIRVHRTYDTAFWNVPQESLTKDLPDIDKIIVHELLHVVMRDLNKAEYDMVEVVGGHMGDQFAERLEHEIEGVIERLSRSIVGSLLDLVH